MSASQDIDKQIADLGDWRGELYTKIRKLIHEVDPEIVEEFKWGTGVFTHKGMICAIGTFKDHVKINFFQGAFLSDPQNLFNAGLEAKKTRGIDIHEGEVINESALKELINVAVKKNQNS